MRAHMTNKFDKETEQQGFLKKPDTIHVLSEIMHRWYLKHSEQCALPPHPEQAARHWVFLQEKPSSMEAPNIIAKKGGGSTWNTPYLDRLVNTLNKFLHFGLESQNYIISAHKAGIPWRGDDMDFFKKVVEQTEEMREIGVDKYRARATTSDIGMSYVNATCAPIYCILVCTPRFSIHRLITLPTYSCGTNMFA